MKLGKQVVITDHAVVQFRERVVPYLTKEEAAAVLERIAPDAQRADQYTFKGDPLWEVLHPACFLVTGHDGATAVVTVISADMAMRVESSAGDSPFVRGLPRIPEKLPWRQPLSTTAAQEARTRLGSDFNMISGAIGRAAIDGHEEWIREACKYLAYNHRYRKSLQAWLLGRK
jgi:acetylornithine deacetylase/succinyl-diaminopimelate desuccinylase-like protein